MGENHRQGHQAGWTEPRTARMRKLWLDGKSAEEIARDLGGGVTRNAVIGKVHREGLSERKPAAGGSKPFSPHVAGGRNATAKARPKAPAAPPRPLAADSTTAVPRVAPAPLPPDPEVAGQKLVTLLELGAHACKWPVGMPQPDQLFCGRRQEAGRPYCVEHGRVAFSAASGLAKHSPTELARSLRRYL